MITDIYRIKTMNSFYEIQVSDDGRSRCRKLGTGIDIDGFTVDAPWRKVKASPSFLEKLVIGASFDVPGVVLTSVVEDYFHFVPSTEPKRTLNVQAGIKTFFAELTGHLVEQVQPQAVMVAAPIGEPAEDCGWQYADGKVCTLAERDHGHVGQHPFEAREGCKEPGCTYSSNYGPGHFGSKGCKSGSIASGGTRSHCSCDYCY